MKRLPHKPAVPTLRPPQIALPSGLGNIITLEAELQDMMDVLLGRVPPPYQNGTLTMMEVADAYHARAQEIRILIYRGEQAGKFAKGGPAYRFRTTQLAAFIDLVRNVSALGSRRLTEQQVRQQAELTGREQ